MLLLPWLLLLVLVSFFWCFRSAGRLLNWDNLLACFGLGPVYTYMLVCLIDCLSWSLSWFPCFFASLLLYLSPCPTRCACCMLVMFNLWWLLAKSCWHGLLVFVLVCYCDLIPCWPVQDYIYFWYCLWFVLFVCCLCTPIICWEKLKYCCHTGT